ncbi:MAG: DNA-binding response regulator, partial [Caulobacteraceae bacterium]|nr:DNA-binding response regulator [Caulobacteraceae bacterium]
IDTHISRLRKKLEDGFERPLLHTLRGTGYRLSEAP